MSPKGLPHQGARHPARRLGVAVRNEGVNLKEPGSAAWTADTCCKRSLPSQLLSLSSMWGRHVPCLIARQHGSGSCRRLLPSSAALPCIPPLSCTPIIPQPHEGKGWGCRSPSVLDLLGSPASLAPAHVLSQEVSPMLVCKEQLLCCTR